MSADEIRAKDLFPRGFLPLPHVKHETASMIFPTFLTDSYFVVAHFHFVLVGSLIFTIFGASITGSPRRRAPVERAARSLALLALRRRVQPHVPAVALGGDARLRFSSSSSTLSSH
jgi:hypothetical protein